MQVALDVVAAAQSFAMATPVSDDYDFRGKGVIQARNKCTDLVHLCDTRTEIKQQLHTWSPGQLLHHLGRNILRLVECSFWVEPLLSPAAGSSLLCKQSHHGQALVVPAAVQSTVLEKAHSCSLEMARCSAAQRKGRCVISQSVTADNCRPTDPYSGFKCASLVNRMPSLRLQVCNPGEQEALAQAAGVHAWCTRGLSCHGRPAQGATSVCVPL